jgi:Putative Actinobacterial Holin-X, holin superfamily III
MSDHAQGDRVPPSGDSTAADFVAQMVQGLGGSLRREVEQLRTELADRAAGGAKGAGLLAGAGAAGTVALAATASLPLMALRRVLPGWVIALGVAGGAGALTVVLARRGLSELGAAAPIDAERIKDAAREAVRSFT